MRASRSRCTTGCASNPPPRCRRRPTSPPDGGFDGFVGCGGGSCLDTRQGRRPGGPTHPANIMEYVNAPVGAGRNPRPAAPADRDPHHVGHRLGGDHGGRPSTCPISASDQHLATPTCVPTRGHRRSRTDPQPAAGWRAASAGLDVVCHAAESYLSRPYKPARRTRLTDERPPYQARTRSPTSGRPKRSRMAGATCAVPWPTARTSGTRLHDARRVAGPGSASVRPACTSPTPARVSDRRAQARLPTAGLASNTTSPPTGSRSSSPHRASFRHTSPATRPSIGAWPSCSPGDDRGRRREHAADVLIR